MNRRSDKVQAAIAIIIVCLFMALTSGCIEEEQSQPATPSSAKDPNMVELDFITPVENTTLAVYKRPQWGNGNPPDSWTETFGNDNGARMDFVQMRMLSEQAARIKVLEEFCRISGANRDGKKD